MPLMTIPELIRKKRDGGELTDSEVRHVIEGYTREEVPDYQMSALLMAIYFKGLTPDETISLTMAMVDSGRKIDLSGIPGPKVDKHSTGGVGDKTTLVLAPLVAAAGLSVAKLSGRGLGHTGGTLDKLESIPGFTVNLPIERFVSQVGGIGLAIAGQGPDLVPADGKIYALRDITATVESIPLIAASVMSKKIAGGADVIVLDIKVGKGAFMKDPLAAQALATAMEQIGAAAGRKVITVMSAMEQPLGRAVGNALEVREALETLSGGGPPDLRELCLELGTRLLLACGELGEDGGNGETVKAFIRRRLEALLDGGAARRKFADMVEAQGGDARVVEDFDMLPSAPLTFEVKAPANGYVHSVDALAIGSAAVVLGAGRRKKGDPIDSAVGVVVLKKVGDEVSKGQPVAVVHAREAGAGAEAVRRVEGAYDIRIGKAGQLPLFIR